MAALDEIVNYTRANDWVAYYARPGDVNRNGIPDRADLFDGNGVDCSGWVWLVLAYLARQGWFHGLPYLPLGSTSTYAAYARDHEWIRANNRYGLGSNQAIPGDVLIHSSNQGNVYDSDGPDGHCGILVQRLPDGRWLTSESASSKSGVGFYPRLPSWWHMSIAIPGMGLPPANPTGDDMFDPNTDGRLLRDIHQALPEIRKVAAAVDILVKFEAGEGAQIKDLHQALPMIRGIATKLGVPIS